MQTGLQLRFIGCRIPARRLAASTSGCFRALAIIAKAQVNGYRAAPVAGSFFEVEEQMHASLMLYDELSKTKVLVSPFTVKVFNDLTYCNTMYYKFFGEHD